MRTVVIVLLQYTCYFHTTLLYSHGINPSKHPEWIVNYPREWPRANINLNEVFNDSHRMSEYETYVNNRLKRYYIGKQPQYDGEEIDSIEHFFWGLEAGITIELGSRDGTPKTASRTFNHERWFKWKRILIEGQPEFRVELPKRAPQAVGICITICTNQTQLHYIGSGYCSGIAEFMDKAYLENNFESLFSAATSYNDGNENSGVVANLASVNWTALELHGLRVRLVDCLSLTEVLMYLNITHVHFFVLDVEGAEMNVLNSVDWSRISFDVLCIEVAKNLEWRQVLSIANMTSDVYVNEFVTYLGQRGYVPASGIVGKNIWFRRKGFTPSIRPGVEPECWSGAQCKNCTQHI